MLLCLTVPFYKLAAALYDQPVEENSAVLLADKLERGHVVALNDSARKSGARIGMTLMAAQSFLRDPKILVHDPARSAELWGRVLAALDAVSPLIDDAGEGTAFLEMRGISGIPADWIALIHKVLCDIALPFRLGGGNNKFTARAAAFTEDGKICPAGDEPKMLAPLPLSLLDMDAATLERLHLLGIRKLGQLAKLPHGSFVRRFGVQGAQWHRCAQGIDARPFLPRSHEMRIEAALYGEGSADREEQVLFALRKLVAFVAGDIVLLGKRAGVLQLQMECENGDVFKLLIHLAQPTAHVGTMFDLVRVKVEGLVFDSPLLGLRLRAQQLEEGGTPASLFAGSDPDETVVTLTLARLEAVLGSGHALRAHIVDAHRDEARFTYDHFKLPGNPGRDSHATQALPSQPTAQFRLLNVHEIEVKILKSGPAFVGNPPQRVIDYAGPWRIDESWFDQAVTRDEYDVLLEDGTLARIYQSGDNWYLQGTYD
ncbi:MAG: DNA polymerase Y family protein [Candidatus Eremiobacteraeota bacterium]|nr:DNA polymerase Y family protein [Candidatus Eremiobacteraeota bacterium]MDQ6932835.1 DNA polymerase Y family protein [Candidatus Eremiobacteraeota bacterium]